jgi:glucose/mannose transport system substrate-binding protein
MKPTLRRCGKLACTLAAVSVLGGCDGASGSSAGSGGSSDDNVGGASASADEEVFVLTYWNSDGASDELTALYDTTAAFEAHHQHVSVVPVAVAQQDVVEQAKSQLALRPKAPHLFQRPDYQSLLELDGSGAVLDLSELFAEQNWDGAIPGEVLDDGFSIAGKPMAIPTSMHRVNAIYYNKPLLAGHGLGIPETLEQLKALVQDLRALDTTPLLMGNLSSEPLWQFAYQCLAPHVMGPQHAKDFFQGLATGDDPKFIELLNTVLFFRCGPNPGATCDGYFNRDTDAFDEDAAASAFVEGFRGGPAYALYPSGDWVQPKLSAAGLKPGVDYDVFVCPVANAGDTAVFVGRPEGWMVGTGSDSAAFGLELPRYLGSVEGQVTLNAGHGSIPVRTDIDLAEYGDAFDVLQSKTLQDFATSPYWYSGQKPGSLPSHADELKAAMQAGSIELVANYVFNNYKTLVTTP